MNALELRRRVLMMAQKKSRLPSQYQEVEWLKCPAGSSTYNATGYIDLGIVPEATSVSTCVFKFPNQFIFNQSYVTIFGSRDNNGNWLANFGGGGNSDTRLYVWYNREHMTFVNPVLNWAKISMRDSGALLESLDTGRIYNVSYSARYFPNVTMSLFAYNNNGSYRQAPDGVVIKSFTHEKSGVVVRDMVPCFRKSDSKPGMYDLCGSTCPLTNSPFYINAGTGEFIVGADVN